MNSNQLTVSAALYFAPAHDNVVPASWLESAYGFFVASSLSPILFTADGPSFMLDDCNVMSSDGRDVTMWDEVIRERGTVLRDQVGAGTVQCLGIDTPHEAALSRSDFRACMTVFMSPGKLYIGADDDLIDDCNSAIRQAHDMAIGCFDIRYGVAYRMRLADKPDCYASGFRSSSLKDVRSFLHNRREWENRQKSPDELWQEEMNGQRRYLTGLFRGAYPASVLSEAHVRAANLLSEPIGTLSKMSETLWLWELSDEEQPVAERMLQSRRLLVRQAYE